MQDQSYEVILTIDGIGYNDVVTYVVFRNPIEKQSSFSLLKIYLPQMVIKGIENEINNNSFPKFNLKIYVNVIEPSEKSVKLIYDQTLQCLKIKPEQKLDFYSHTSMHAKLLLVHPIVYYLSQTNTYNKLFIETTAMGVLGSFDGFLKQYHGDIFDFNYIGSDVNLNEYIYEQLLIKATNDINVPTYLINNFKINNSYTFYFFDNFFVKDTFKKEVVNHYINIYDYSKFTQVDVEEFADKIGFVQFLKQFSLKDAAKKLVEKSGQRTILNEKNIRMFHEKVPEKVDLPKKEPGGELETEFNQYRIQKFETDGSETTEQYDSSSKYSTIYCPDSSGNGSSRFSIAIDTLSEKIRAIDMYQFNYSLPDFPQFGEIYNLFEGNIIEKYLVTPISIINIFKRNSQKEPDLDHMCKSLFIHFKK